jgi:hypothetical protein
MVPIHAGNPMLLIIMGKRVIMQSPVDLHPTGQETPMAR